jgi:hypothetical protein
MYAGLLDRVISGKLRNRSCHWIGMSLGSPSCGITVETAPTDFIYRWRYAACFALVHAKYTLVDTTCWVTRNVAVTVINSFLQNVFVPTVDEVYCKLLFRYFSQSDATQTCVISVSGTVSIGVPRTRIDET